MDAGDDDPPVLLDRASRATRGKRITKLLEDEIEQDEVFWNQQALKDDEENDDNYEEEQDAGDEFDSDFDRHESEPDDEPEKEERERLPIKKRLMFPGKTLRKTNVKKKKVTTKLEDDAKADKPSPSTQADVPDELETEKTIRKSTRTSVIVRQAEREAIRAEKEATVKPIKKKKEGEEKRMTQEEMLLEAAETDPEKSVCVVTGLPAKYRDPKTGLPYATMEAFKIIRERFLKEEADRKRPNMANMGELFESIAGEHSAPKKRRVEVRSPSISGGLRHGGRFRRIPALDMVDED
ncbi:SWR1 complex subunit 2 isoform X3 [Panicum virgatum]|uniref:SWR1 complex subunit 2 isoform X3 n=1 Tax=Panicum virgatum TaxID=38727 RepID=UPI0019D67C86|nr:SWR1 complex subunit 2 isoform X3 [Panicum virgatum]